MLNEMRFGRLSNKSIARWKSLSREVEYKDGINATELSVCLTHEIIHYSFFF